MDLIESLPEGAPRHPWETARSTFILNILRYYKLSTYSTWLDIGSGDAWLAGRVSRSVPNLSRFVGWDINYSANDIATLSSDFPIELVAEPPVGQFQVILMLDVLEHVEDDQGFLQHAVLHLLDGDGWVLITVPAYQFLFSEHDRVLHHFRRYSPSACRELILDSGLQIVNQGGLYSSLLLPRLVQNLSERRSTVKVKKTASARNHGGVLTNSFTTALEIEGAFDFWLSRRSRKVLPGLSYWALCRRST